MKHRQSTERCTISLLVFTVPISCQRADPLEIDARSLTGVTEYRRARKKTTFRLTSVLFIDSLGQLTNCSTITTYIRHSQTWPFEVLPVDVADESCLGRAGNSVHASPADHLPATEQRSTSGARHHPRHVSVSSSLRIANYRPAAFAPFRSPTLNNNSVTAFFTATCKRYCACAVRPFAVILIV